MKYQTIFPDSDLLIWVSHIYLLIHDSIHDNQESLHPPQLKTVVIFMAQTGCGIGQQF